MNYFEEERGISSWIKFGIGLVIVSVTLSILIALTVQPTFERFSPSNERIEEARLKGHVLKLSDSFAPRNYKRYWNLEKTAGYISNHLAQAGGQMTQQVYPVDGRDYRNVIATFGPKTDSRIVVGAHYDTCQETPGADDNASGIAGLIELAYLLGKTDLKQQVDVVAYTLEEPPFFRSPDMGSARHAYALKKAGVDIEAMICLEMIGCFSDIEGSQRYPSMLSKMLYPDAGNFIAVIGSYGDRKLVKNVKISMRSATDLPVHAMCASKSMKGIDYSDHRNYWNNDFTAIMITDTAFLRNYRYHQSSDTEETLDYTAMSKVVIGVYEAVVRLAND